MQEEYTGTLLEDGHIHIPQEIIDKLKIYKGSKRNIKGKDSILCWLTVRFDRERTETI